MFGRRQPPQRFDDEMDASRLLEWAILACTLPVLFFAAGRAKLGEWFRRAARARHRLVPIPIETRRPRFDHRRHAFNR
jgi:hypothetical protein